MESKQKQEILATYLGIIEEIKVRLASISTIANCGLPPTLVRESCHLQFRMVSELIALGCMVAHGDIKQVNSAEMRKAYQADKIMRALSELHPDFYPVPSDQVRVAPGSYRFDPKKETFLTKADLIALYTKSGPMLHRGGLKNLLKARVPVQRNFPDVVEIHRKFVRLLEHHSMKLVDGQFLICGISGRENGGAAYAGFAEAASPEDADRLQDSFDRHDGKV